MGLYRNVASQKIAVYAYDVAADGPKTGDAANITAQISKDFGAAAASNDTNPAELDATDHPGVYVFDLTQAETDADNVLLTPVSATADIVLDPVQVFTVPPNFRAMGIESDGHVHADLKQWLGVAPLALASQFVRVSAGAIDDGLLTAAKFAAGAFDAVWSVATRTLTSIAGQAAELRAAVGLGSANLDTQLSGLDTAIGTRASQASVSALNNLSAAQVNAEVDTAISDAALATAANLALAKTAIDAIKVITDALTAAAAAKLAASALGIITGTVDTTVAPSTTEFECDDITEATADHYIGRIVTFTSGVLAGQSTDITDYALASGKGHFTVTALTEAPGNNDTLVIT